MTRWLLPLLLVAGFLAGGIAYAPLDTVLQMSGATKRGVNWANANGSVLEGQLQGIVANGQPYGDAALQLKPLSLLSGKLTYAVDWTGERGRGSGDVSVGPGGRLSLKDFDIDLDLLQLEQTARWIQQSGGHVKLQGAVIRFDGNACAKAEGTASSDVLDRNSEILGAGWSQMRGDLRCEGRELVVPLEATNSTGTMFAARIYVAPDQPGRFEARVSGLIPRELLFALPIAGFVPDGRDFVYKFTPSIRSRPI